MEYKIAKFFGKIRLPYVVRCILGVFMLLIALLIAIVPVIPGALITAVIGVLFLIPCNKIKYLIKIRKSLVYMFTNFKKENICRIKFKDIKKNLIKMLTEQRKKRKIYINSRKIKTTI